MITVITGVPGAGKTAYCVEKLLLPVAGKPEKAVDSKGNEVEFVRRIYTNINGLLIDHEKIDETHLNTWHEWAKPGDLIVFDEVQDPWPLVATGKAKPDYIQKLETHRHMGVDFIVMSQHPMLFDAQLSRLAGRHLHVRKLGNSRFATVYEWDGISRTLLYKNSLAKAPWRRSKLAEQSYQSSALHTKQKRATPTLLYAVCAAAVAMAFVGPYAWGRISERMNPPPIAIAKPAAKITSTTTTTPPSSTASAPAPAPAPGVPVPSVTSVVATRLAGCASMAGKCTCFQADGTVAPTEPEMCRTTLGAHLPAVAAPPASLVEARPPRAPGGYAGWVRDPMPKGSTAADVVAAYR